MKNPFVQGSGERSVRRGFTLIEMMASMAVLTILMLAVFGLTDQLSRAWKMSQSKIEMFRDARAAFFTITQRLRQATLNTYWDYDNVNAPTRYARNSNLHFVSGPAAGLIPGAGKYAGNAIFFTAPLGYTADRTDLGELGNMINGCGYFVEYSQESALPAFLAPGTVRKWRWRLRQFMEPAETSLVQATGWTSGSRMDWFRSYFTAVSGTPPVHDLADNIILLLVLPRLPAGEDRGDALAADYIYDSRLSNSFTTQPPPASAAAGYTGSSLHQLPPLVRVVMVAIDEKSALRLNPQNSSTPPVLVPAGLFAKSADLDADLQQLEKALVTHPGLAYRIFDTTVSLRGAKWSRD